jgi:hypothetical protein
LLNQFKVAIRGSGQRATERSDDFENLVVRWKPWLFGRWRSAQQNISRARIIQSYKIESFARTRTLSAVAHDCLSRRLLV